MSNNIPLALYFHWPYCLSKCPYCDFNSHVAASVDHERWRKAYRAEIEALHRQCPDRVISSVFFGGGTPSLMEARTIDQITGDIARLWGLDGDVEVTLEANPTSTEATKFADFKAAGINRVSIGVQALNDSDLKALGRHHSAAEALEAVAIARRLFERFSFDLIYTRSGHTLKAWENELRAALPHADGGHMSLYQLTIEAGTQFQTLYDSGRLTIPEHDVAAQFYDLTAAIMEDAGMPAYEISNYAKAGQESRHNLAYWTYADYAGIGPGAHGRLTFGGEQTAQSTDSPAHTRIATRAHKAPDIWLKTSLDAPQNAPSGTPAPTLYGALQNPEILTPFMQFEEMVMMGLRLRRGLDFAAVHARTGVDPQDHINHAAVAALCADGYITQDGTVIALTAKGMPVLNAVLRAILL